MRKTLSRVLKRSANEKPYFYMNEEQLEHVQMMSQRKNMLKDRLKKRDEHFDLFGNGSGRWIGAGLSNPESESGIISDDGKYITTEGGDIIDV